MKFEENSKLTLVLNWCVFRSYIGHLLFAKTHHVAKPVESVANTAVELTLPSVDSRMLGVSYPVDSFCQSFVFDFFKEQHHFKLYMNEVSFIRSYSTSFCPMHAWQTADAARRSHSHLASHKLTSS